MISTFNIEKLLSLLKDFHTLTGIRITVFDECFREIAAYPKEQGEFCRIIRSDSRALAMCNSCDKEACQKASNRHGTYVYQCHAGLKEAITPIYLGNLVVGYLFFGQVFSYESYEKGWEIIKTKCAGYSCSIAALHAACMKQPLVTEDYILSASNLMNAIASYLCLERMAALRYENLPVQIDDYIQKHLTEEIGVKEICDHFQIGKTQLYKIARESYGIGIAEFIRRQRIEKAKNLLRDAPGLSISEVGYRCGFMDYNNFITLFRRITGITPGKYRDGKASTTDPL